MIFLNTCIIFEYRVGVYLQNKQKILIFQHYIIWQNNSCCNNCISIILINSASCFENLVRQQDTLIISAAYFDSTCLFTPFVPVQDTGIKEIFWGWRLKISGCIDILRRKFSGGRVRDTDWVNGHDLFLQTNDAEVKTVSIWYLNVIFDKIFLSTLLHCHSFQILYTPPSPPPKKKLI